MNKLGKDVSEKVVSNENNGQQNPLKKKIIALIVLFICIAYILNPGLGFFEFIPDNLPFIGNLDEAGATMLLIKCFNILRDK